MAEHRRAERHQLKFKVIFDDGESYNAGEVEDISETGLYMHTSTAIPPESIVRFEGGEDDGLFEVAGRVVRCDDLDGRTDATHGLAGVAIEFIAMTPDEKAGVAAMIDHLEGVARQRSASGVRDPMLGVVVKGAAEAAAADAESAPETEDGEAPERHEAVPVEAPEKD